MNLGFANRAVRCRVTRAELDRLLSGRAVSLEIALPRDHRFRANVRTVALRDWQLDSDPTGLWLAIPRTELESFAQLLPSEQSLQHTFEANGDRVVVSFEVDVP